MNNIEREIISSLKYMKEEYDLVGIKGEFESEGAQLGELMRLKEITMAVGVDMVVKIGGCEAITDMHQARCLGASHIVAPMIESAFAAKKFLNAIKTVFRNNEDRINFLINVETINGAKNFGEICTIENADSLSGLDIGRVDLASSMGLSAEGCNDAKVLDVCRDMCKIWYKHFPDKTCTIGGLLNVESIVFLNALASEYPIAFESKKTVFSHNTICSGRLKDVMLAAIRFETLWYDYCMDNYRQLSSNNWSYFKALPKYEAILKG